MPKFRKRPVVIEAVQFTRRNAEWLAEWSGGEFHHQPVDDGLYGVQYELTLSIPTLEGVMTAREDDWVIRGVKGEFYPCRPDIFAATYEPVPSSPEDQEGAKG